MNNSSKSINDKQTNDFLEQNNFSDAVKSLLKSQKQSWPLLASGYLSLSSIKTKSIEFDGYIMTVQFNPGRHTSSSAKVDKKSVEERKCFLCINNLPDQQRGILTSEFIILANPFPIFPEHFTISSLEHKAQQIKDSFHTLLYFSKLLSRYYTVFYNGPLCGASAPDHLHFQACSKYAMPMDIEFDKIKLEFGELLLNKNGCKVFGINDGIRRIISFEGNNDQSLIQIFNSFYTIYSSSDNSSEPMMNIHSFYHEEKGWRILIMLRAKHRPDAFYSTGDDYLLFSPASADYGGLCITPREVDFEKFNKEIIMRIFNEVSMSPEAFTSLVKNMKQS
jgi:hypothetical protein